MGRLVGWLACWLVTWLTGCLAVWLASWVEVVAGWFGWPLCSFTICLAPGFDGLLIADRLVGRLAGWLTGWLAVWHITCLQLGICWHILASVEPCRAYSIWRHVVLAGICLHTLAHGSHQAPHVHVISGIILMTSYEVNYSTR